MPNTPKGPLQGVRVVDLTTVMLGPFCTQILGEMGAEVIKIETPDGDVNRWTGESRSPGMSTGQLIKGRNKRSIVLDLKIVEAREAFEKLIKTADVFVHNIRPKAASRLAIDYETIAELNPSIIYASATGFGEAGPFADKPAYDDLIQGASGIASLYGKVTGTPRYIPSVMADKTTGLFLSNYISMALFHKERTGEGQKLHVPMYETFTAFVISEHMQGQTFVPATGPAGYTRMLTVHRKPYETMDGFICVVPYTQKHWINFLTLVGEQNLIEDPRFSSQTERTKNIDALYEIVSDSMKTRTTSDWLITLTDADIPAGPMNSPEDLFDCPHLDAVGMFPEIEHPTEGRIKHIKVPVTFSKTPGGLYRHSEKLGESTHAVLSELGFSKAEIINLQNTGATTPKK
jgi:crotonobetainyl-CoA:carnitine CoA-transferase CaiB-like acyl-CoA transferase|tara:strand:+ start:879 stop:2087 length:1209 start_codon:yes stop_codon:yes gene_type:complete